MEFEAIKKEFVVKFAKDGCEKFYKFLLFTAINNIVLKDKSNSIELDYLNFYEKFMILYRREGCQEYLTMASLFRKAANKIYRYRLKNGFCERNLKFLNVV